MYLRLCMAGFTDISYLLSLGALGCALSLVNSWVISIVNEAPLTLGLFNSCRLCSTRKPKYSESKVKTLLFPSDIRSPTLPAAHLILLLCHEIDRFLFALLVGFFIADVFLTGII